jgi:hypothetical protein
MVEQEVREFFREKKANARLGKVDWKAKKSRWVKAVGDLFRKIIDEYLAGPIREKTIAVSFRQKRVVEDRIGQYTIRELILCAGEEVVILSPKAANVVGASGRIDLRGDLGEVNIVLQTGGRWSIIESRTPTLKLVPLTQESLLAALRRVMR